MKSRLFYSFHVFFLLKLETMHLSVLLLFCLFICLLIFVCGDARFKERARAGIGEGEVLTWASGYNFPLFLVYQVDMPVQGNMSTRIAERE